jgi:hypothetical protein
MNWIPRILRQAESGSLKGGDLRKDEDKKPNGVVRGQVPGPPTIGADNPIRKPEDDVLGRTELARCFAEQALSLDATEGVVVGC